MPKLATTSKLLLLSALIAASSGCAIVGNVRPVEEKSETYGYLDLSKTNPDWVKLSPQASAGADDHLEPTEVTDVAFQSKDTASIISLNSACRKNTEMVETDLRELTNQLLLGMTDITLREEKGLEIRNTPALQTTVQGTLAPENGSTKASKKKRSFPAMMLRTVVLRRGGCVYDMVYMARPQFFAKHEQDFSQFVASLRLK